MKEMGQESSNFTDFLLRGMHFLTASLEQALKTIQMYEAVEDVKKIQDKEEPLIKVVGEQEGDKIVGEIKGVSKQIRGN
jgi:phosphosulfolactate phosphohydrolase-like enzyme